MKKTIALILSIALMASLFVFPASATFRRGETKVWIPDEPGYQFHTPGLKLSNIDWARRITEQDIADAIANAQSGVIPAGARVTAGRLLVIEEMVAEVPEENLPIQITFSVEEANKMSLCVFYRAEASETWELVSVSPYGPLIECELPANGQYAVAWGW